MKKLSQFWLAFWHSRYWADMMLSCDDEDLRERALHHHQFLDSLLKFGPGGTGQLK